MQLIELHRPRLISSAKFANTKSFTILQTHKAKKQYRGGEEVGKFCVITNHGNNPAAVTNTPSAAWRSVRYLSKLAMKTQRTCDPWEHLSKEERAKVVSVLDVLPVGDF